MLFELMFANEQRQTDNRIHIWWQKKKNERTNRSFSILFYSIALYLFNLTWISLDEHDASRLSIAYLFGYFTIVYFD